MPDEPRILRAAEIDRDHAAKAWQDHVRTEHPDIPHEWCPTCFSLDAHVRRTERQIAVLPRQAESEEMF